VWIKERVSTVAHLRRRSDVDVVSRWRRELAGGSLASDGVEDLGDGDVAGFC